MIKKSLLLASFLVTQSSSAATLTVTNKTGRNVRVFMVNTGINKTIGPGKSIKGDSGLKAIYSVYWDEEGDPEVDQKGQWKAQIDMPSLNLGGTLDIYPNGKFNSSRLGNNKQAVRAGKLPI